jgi:hypothetical protein
LPKGFIIEGLSIGLSIVIARQKIDHGSTPKKVEDYEAQTGSVVQLDGAFRALSIIMDNTTNATVCCDGQNQGTQRIVSVDWNLCTRWVNECSREQRRVSTIFANRIPNHWKASAAIVLLQQHRWK